MHQIVKAIMVQGTRTVLLAVQQVGFVEYALDRVTNNFNTRGQSSHSNRSRWTCPKDPLFSTSDDEDLEEEVDELELLAKEIEVKQEIRADCWFNQQPCLNSVLLVFSTGSFWRLCTSLLSHARPNYKNYKLIFWCRR